MTDKLPPHNVEAEKAVLGAMILNSAAIYHVADIVTPLDFYVDKNRQVYETIMSLNGAGRRCDPVTLDVELNKSSQNGVPWIDYIGELLQYTPDENGAADYARIVAEKATRRRLIAAANTIQQLAHDEKNPVDQQLGQAETALFSVRSTENNNHIAPRDYSDSYIAEFERLAENEREIAGIPTGFYDLDRLLNGLQAPNHYILAARPAMGKTAFAINIAEHAVKLGHNVLFFSLEMSHKQMMDRRVVAHCGIDPQRPWLLSKEQRTTVYETVGELSERKMYIDTTPALTPSKIRAKAMRLHAEIGIDLIVIDHLHLMRPDVNRQRKDIEVDDNIRSMTALYKTLGVPGLTISQLSRAVENRSDKRPLLSDLRESGAIEEEAYVAMFLYRDEYYNPDTTERPNIGEVNVAKNRGGPTGAIDLYWNGRLTSYRNLKREEINL